MLPSSALIVLGVWALIGVGALAVAVRSKNQTTRGVAIAAFMFLLVLVPFMYLMLSQASIVNSDGEVIYSPSSTADTGH